MTSNPYESPNTLVEPHNPVDSSDVRSWQDLGATWLGVVVAVVTTVSFIFSALMIYFLLFFEFPVPD